MTVSLAMETNTREILVFTGSYHEMKVRKSELRKKYKDYNIASDDNEKKIVVGEFIKSKWREIKGASTGQVNPTDVGNYHAQSMEELTNAVTKYLLSEVSNWGDGEGDVIVTPLKNSFD